jgi:hypothetical protein
MIERILFNIKTERTQEKPEALKIARRPCLVIRSSVPDVKTAAASP